MARTAGPRRPARPSRAAAPKRAKRAARTGGRKPINLALQGGGAHGAFTWGVLDAILADGRLDLDAISGTSAGAMNAVVLADGLIRGGRDGAREHLARFWKRVNRSGAGITTLDGMVDRVTGLWGLPGLGRLFQVPGFDAYGWIEQMAMLFSPYRMNPFNINPLRDILSEMVDFERLRKAEAPKLFIAATNVRTGRGRIFTDGELSAAAVLASTTLPYLFQAVEVDGEHYWDGGYSGNPPLWPFYSFDTAEDILLVQVNPVRREEIPETAQEIMERVSEVTFNSALLKELRALDFVNRLMDEHRLDPEKYRINRLHRIEATEALAGFNASSKLDTSWEFFTTLRDAGAAAAKRWLARHFDDVGTRATFDLRKEFA